jgi:hypothetical protein
MTTRRQALRLLVAGSVALGSCAFAASGSLNDAFLAGEPVAAQSAGSSTPTRLLGCGPGSIPAGGPATGVPVEVVSMDLDTGQVQSVSVPQVFGDGTPVLGLDTTLTACSVLSDGAIVLALAPVDGTTHVPPPPRLIRLGQTSATSAVLAGLRLQEQVLALGVGPANTLLGLIQHRHGKSPARLVTIDPQAGTTATFGRVHVPGGARFTALALCPDGTPYATSVDSRGETSLVQLNTGRSQILTSDGDVWNNGLASLVCSGTHQLIGLGAPRYETPNSLYLIDPSTGLMTKVREFDTATLALVDG